MEVRITTPSGRSKWVQFTSLSSSTPSEDVDRRSGLILDVTERKRMEEALRESEERFRETNERLRVADRRKDEFLAMLSHELRNPLAPIRNSIYVLRRTTGAGEQLKRALAVIDRQTRHMARIVDDLLDVTRISRGKITLQRERVDLNELVRGVVDDHREVFARARVELAFQDLPQQLHVYGDRTRLAQALGNLLGNSAKFTPAGGRTSVSIFGLEGDAVIQVRDTGEGVAPEMRHRLFEPFFQADSTLDRTRGGLGLGLALVKGLVEMHGGGVEVESEGPGKGATFTVKLPLEREAGPHLTVVSSGGGSAASRRVLIIEDNLDAAQSLKEALEMGDHQVELAYRGEEGVEKARSFQPDVVLCDIGLPGMDGYAVVRALRTDPQLRSLHVIALSGYASPEDIERSRKAGFDHHVAKPTDLDALEKLLVESPRNAAAG
jgi:two-component system CheB/CheR fusion protein